MSSRNELSIRPAEESDLEPLTEIYNHYVRTTPVTFDVAPFTATDRRAWFEKYGRTGRYRLLVATEREAIIGYASSSPFRFKPAYDTSVETTIYLAPDTSGRGVGTVLYRALFDELEGEDVHRALAGIALPNPSSVALHQKLGFEPVGVFREVGRKFDQFWDVAWYAKPLEG